MTIYWVRELDISLRPINKQRVGALTKATLLI
ncbi:hypothetical protein COLO4_00309 [Corchorus olitorius]|uniref:Uncharacterized protein n=1 Tax=Corchorus olitorius TaxID=93759 RepID=A0A1R3L412_9ROSI|nr:hypothetical protein COLO4_00309 [Corchorus olitorius]